MAGSPLFVTFDGPNRRITVKAGVTNIDVQKDLYSDWTGAID